MTKRFPHLPDIDDCCGCGSCVDTCNHEALSLREDVNGYYNIVIDRTLCVGCGLCEKQCHILHQDNLKRSNPSYVQPLAGWSTNENIIRNSATGGVFSQLAYNMLKEGNTIVVGASLQDNSSVRHIAVSKFSELYKIQNSKYQQSYSVGIYQQVKKHLKDGNRVLFSGTPCQIAALHGFLGDVDQLKRELYTVEVICHGVPTNFIHRIGLKVNHAKRILTYRTKEEGKGWLKGNNKLSYVMSDDSVVVMPNRRKDFIFRTYLSFSFSRKNCYTCKYARMERVSDITLGDFWGFQNSKHSKEYENLMGTSIILPNTVKGRSMIESCKELHVMNADWEDFLPYNQNLYMPTNKYLFIGSEYIHLLNKLPLSLRLCIMQNGFSNDFCDRVYSKVFRFLTKGIMNKKQHLQDVKCKEALSKTGLS